jgi:predicted metal-dependent hydrolase
MNASYDLISKIIRSKRRTLSLEITSDAHLIVRAPLRASLDTIYQIVEKKRSWIIEKQETAKEKSHFKKKHQFIEGEEFLYLGNLCRLHISLNAAVPLTFDGTEFILAQSFQSQAKQLFEKWYTRQAYIMIVPRVRFYAGEASQKYSSISITGAKTRWGSCSFKKNLNFSWRLMMAPVDKIDYVVAHEVAHLEELNHSSRFWNKVKSLMPDYKARQQWFRNNQHLLSF